MAVGSYMLVLVFGFSANSMWGEPRSAVASLDSQHFDGFASQETCEAAASTLGPALVAKYERTLGNKNLKVQYEYLCVNQNP